METQYELEVGGRPLIVASGKFAQQAGGAVTVRYGDTLVLGTATAGKPRPGIDFFPLTVEFEERLYAAGRIPGSFFRREGRPTTSAVLSARLTDRPLRPLFPKGYMDDTQIVITVLSADMENPPDLLGTIAASAALTISDVPFGGPVAAVRIAVRDGRLVVQPTFSELVESSLNLVVAGTKEAIMMVEADAQVVPESLLVDALALGQEEIARIVTVQERMRADLGKPKRPFVAKSIDPTALERVETLIGDDLAAALASDAGAPKADRSGRIAAVRGRVLEELEPAEDPAPYLTAFEEIERRVVRRNILEQGRRPDGREPTEIRPLSAEIGIIPRTHGSGLFQRGETQVLALTTLAGTGMAQKLDDLTPAASKRFMHHYNFPPFSTGETGRVGSPGRREIGHGMLGERAMQAVLPPFEDFPYTIRIVSEVLSSNGSTSMASTCAAVLSMMDAGVPLKAPVAGIAMGLIKGDRPDQFQILTDIAGMEDHLGDMDFKVAGTREGVTALQMDIKVQGITTAIMAQALDQARTARLEILECMAATIATPRTEMSPFAPRMFRVDVPPEKIGMIIGPGGKTIRALEEQSGASIDIQDDGSVFVAATNEESARKAVDAIRGLTKDVVPGEIYTGKVTRIMNFGAFVEILPGKDALVHISELADYRVPSVEDVVHLGDEVMVMVTEIDRLGRINASRRAVLTGDTTLPEGRDGGERRDRGDRGGRSDRSDRGDRGGRGGGGGGGRGARPPAAMAESPQPAPAPAPAPAPVMREETVAVEADEEDDGGPPSADAGGAQRRRRRRRRSPAVERPERQPESNVAPRVAGRSLLSRVGMRRFAHTADDRPGPPPPPRSDFGAPQQH